MCCTVFWGERRRGKRGLAYSPDTVAFLKVLSTYVKIQIEKKLDRKDNLDDN